MEPYLPPLRMLPTTRSDENTHAPAPLRKTVFSDGSRTSQGAGYGFGVYYGHIPVTQRYGSAGPRTEVYDDEDISAVTQSKA